MSHNNKKTDLLCRSAVVIVILIIDTQTNWSIGQ